MKLTVRSFRGGVLVATALLFAVSAWSESKGPISLAHPANVGGKMLPAGNYTVRWQGTGDVQLKIYQGKSEFASVPGRIVQLSSPAAVDSVVITNEDGTPSLYKINFGGKKFALQVAGQAGGSGSAGAGK